MRGMRYWTVALLAWLAVFHNIERVHRPINISWMTYVLTAYIAVAVAAIPKLQRSSLAQLCVAAGALFVVLKIWVGRPIAGEFLPITVTEICAMAVTIALAWRVTRCLDEFEQSACELTAMHLGGRSTSFEAGEPEMYRELRRARQFDRPLVLVELAPADESVEASVSRLIQEVQRRTIRRHVDARLAELLVKATNVCDIVAYKDGHFLLLLPERSREQAGELMRQVEEAAGETLGLTLHYGMASFPDEEVTFAGLLERAEGELRSGEFEAIPGPAFVEPVAEPQHA